MIKTVFDFQKHITQFKTPASEFSDADWGIFNSYVLHRVMSMIPQYIEIANTAQEMLPTDKKGIYNFYLNMTPKKSIWGKYIKPKVKKNNKELVAIISKYFECGGSEANHYINIMGKEEVRLILMSMGKDKKEITKLFKR
jgi:hypothetical protein